MNPYTGATYPSVDAAIGAGEKPEHLVEIRGGRRAIGRVKIACKNEAERRRRKRKAQKLARKRQR